MIAKKSVTIKDVARAAGVSAQTVSRVLNDRADVSVETRQRVREVIAELKYSPNILARSLIQGRSHTIGVVGYGLSYYGPSRTLTGLERRANELGYSLLLGLVRDPEASTGQAVLDNLLMRKVDGIIWAIPEIGVHHIDLLDAMRSVAVPVIFINSQPRPELTVVGVDNFSGGCRAVEHLLSQGCRKVGIITGPDAWLDSRLREDGWRSVMLASGLVDQPSLERLKVAGDWYSESGDRALEQLLSQDPSIDAVFAFNDQMALGALKAAQRLGRRVPQDLAVVGFDDVPEANFFCPALTTLRQPLIELGSEAVRMLHHILSLKDDAVYQPEQIMLQPELVIRASSVR